MNAYREQRRREKRAIVVLREEYEEASGMSDRLVASAGLTALAGALAASIGIHERVAALPFVGVFWGATVVCLVALWRARRVVRRWRDQERERLSGAEKDGTSG